MVRLLFAAVLACSMSSTAGADTICFSRSKQSLQSAQLERDILETRLLFERGVKIERARVVELMIRLIAVPRTEQRRSIIVGHMRVLDHGTRD